MKSKHSCIDGVGQVGWVGLGNPVLYQIVGVQVCERLERESQQVGLVTPC